MPQKGYKQSDEHRAAISAAKAGCEMTEDHKANIREAVERHWRTNSVSDGVRVTLEDMERRLDYKVDLSSATSQIECCEWMVTLIKNDPRVSNSQLARELKELVRIAAMATVNDLDRKIAEVTERFLEIRAANDVLREHIAREEAGEEVEEPRALPPVSSTVSAEAAYFENLQCNGRPRKNVLTEAELSRTPEEQRAFLAAAYERTKKSRAARRAERAELGEDLEQ